VPAKNERAEQVMIIGLDAPIVPRLRRLAKQGKLPHFQKLIEQGVIADNCMVPYPTITPPNWTTIVTGAWAGTHGITCFHVHKPGDPLDKSHAGFLSEDNQAEYLWQAITPDGSKVFVCNGYSKNISVVSTAENKVIDTIPMESTPAGIDISPDGRVAYIIDLQSDVRGFTHVVALDVATHKIIQRWAHKLH